MYFKTENKEVIEAVKMFVKEYSSRLNKLLDFSEKYKAELYTRDRLRQLIFYGLKFRDEHPKGWTKPDKDGISKPRKDNKEVWQEINAIPEISGARVLELLNFTKPISKTVFDPRGGCRTLITLGYERHGDVLLFEFPDDYLKDVDHTWIKPDHAIEILHSEYMKIRENED